MIIGIDIYRSLSERVLLIYKRIKTLATKWILDGQIEEIEGNLNKGKAEFEGAKRQEYYKDYYMFSNKFHKIMDKYIWGGKNNQRK